MQIPTQIYHVDFWHGTVCIYVYAENEEKGKGVRRAHTLPSACCVCTQDWSTAPRCPITGVYMLSFCHTSISDISRAGGG